MSDLYFSNYQLHGPEHKILSYLNTLPSTVSDLPRKLHAASSSILGLSNARLLDSSISQHGLWVFSLSDLGKRHLKSLDARSSELTVAKPNTRLHFSQSTLNENTANLSSRRLNSNDAYEIPSLYGKIKKSFSEKPLSE